MVGSGQLKCMLMLCVNTFIHFCKHNVCFSLQDRKLRTNHNTAYNVRDSIIFQKTIKTVNFKKRASWGGANPIFADADLRFQGVIGTNWQ